MEVYLENTESMARYIKDLWEGGKFANHDDMLYAAEICADYLGTFVPYKTGALRDAYNVGFSSDGFWVTWDGRNKLPYAHYQWEGLVMGPNFAVFDENKKQLAGEWRSPAGEKKKYTGRHIGEKRTVKISKGRVVHIDGYTKIWSRPEWIKVALETPTVYYPMRYKVGRYLYEAWCVRAGVPIVGRKEFF